MPPTRNFPRFCDPDEFDQDPGKQNHFPTVYVRCLDCGGPAWFNITKRAGQCGYPPKPGQVVVDLVL